MTGGKMISQSGAMFYCTNTSSVVNLRSAKLVLSDTGDLLIVSAGRWGKDGKNGGKCTFNAEDQTLEGNITVDGIKRLLNMLKIILTREQRLDYKNNAPDFDQVHRFFIWNMCSYGSYGGIFGECIVSLLQQEQCAQNRIISEIAAFNSTKN